ncbi:MAG: hypothetical protein H0U76_18715 [Ktedonobacteraceae bacterium]|nr:hypothetical protein [Ktedonobacteraceae bacterium]
MRAVEVMQEPKTWREFLGKIIEDLQEKQRLAGLLGINERTLDRWAKGSSSPRSSAHVRQLLKALPDHRGILSTLMRPDFPDAVGQVDEEQSIFIDEVIKDVPIPFYQRILETYATAVEPVRTWTICNLVLQQLAQQLDVDHQGIRVLLMQCQASKETGRVHSLRLLFEHTSGQAVSENWPFFYGAESLAGLAVMKGIPQIKQRISAPDSLPHSLQHFPLKSAAAAPIQCTGRCAGTLLVLSPHTSFFTQARMTVVQHYIYLLTLAFREQEFYDRSCIDLQLMAAENAQMHMLDTFQERVLSLFCQAREHDESLTWKEAEQLAASEIETSLGQLVQRAQDQQEQQ